MAGYTAASIRKPAPANLAIPVPRLLWRHGPVPHLFPFSSIDWTTVFCIGRVTEGFTEGLQKGYRRATEGLKKGFRRVTAAGYIYDTVTSCV